MSRNRNRRHLSILLVLVVVLYGAGGGGKGGLNAARTSQSWKRPFVMRGTCTGESNCVAREPLRFHWLATR